jgi:hypothetical protein
MDRAMVVNERLHRLNGRSSSAWAKYADVFLRIPFAWRSSRTSRSRALRRTSSSLVGPAHFLTKRLKNVRTEMALSVLAYNLTRVMNILGIGPLIVAIRA